jgi:hypothetical protein
MSSASVQTSYDPRAKACLEFFDLLFGNYHPRDFAIRFWDGSGLDPDPGQAATFTLHLKHPGALHSMFCLPSGLSIAEAYLFDDYDQCSGRLEGDAFLGQLAFEVLVCRTPSSESRTATRSA